MPIQSQETEELDKPARLQQIFDAFAAHGAPGAAGTATYLFKLGGSDGGRFLLTLSPAGATWQPDYEGEAEVTIGLSTDDFLAIADGKMDGRLAVASERIEISGDMELAASMLARVSPDDDLD